MAGHSGLITDVELYEKIKVPETSTTTTVAEYLKIGDNEYKITGDASVSFTLQEVEGAIVTDYNLTDAQVAEFSDPKRKYLVLRWNNTSTTHLDQLLTAQERSETSVKFTGGDKKKWSFIVDLTAKTGKFQDLGEILSDKEIISTLIVPSEIEVPTKYATAIKFGDTYWGVSEEMDKYVKRSGDRMTGPLILDRGSETRYAYITATENVQSVSLFSPGHTEVSGLGITVADKAIHIGGGNLNDSLVEGVDDSGNLYLKWLNSPVITQAQVMNKLDVSTAGYALDARQGKILNQTKIGSSGGAMNGHLILGKDEYGEGSITASKDLGYLLLRYPEEEEVGRQIMIDARGVYLTRTDGSGLRADFANLRLTWLAKVVLTEAMIKNSLEETESGFVLDARTGVTIQNKINEKISTPQDDVGMRTQPVYVSNEGKFIACEVFAGGTSVTLNGTSHTADTASFYAPTTSGSANQLLASTGANGDPVWKDIINDATHTETDLPLSAAMGKALNDRIDSLSSVGRFLSLWDSALGIPKDEPTVPLYTYKTGDYYIVGTISSSSTNYRPSGTTYSKGTVSTVVETEPVKVGDYYRYSGTSWMLEPMQQQEVSFKTLTGAVADNAALVSEFGKYLPLTGGTVTGVLYIGESSSIQAKGDALTLLSKIGTNGPSISLTSSTVSLGRAGYSLVINGTDSKLTWNNSRVLTEDDIVNNLMTGGATKALSAEQGKVLDTNKVSKSGDTMSGVLTMGLKGEVPTYITSTQNNTNGVALFSPNLASTNEGMAVEVKDNMVLIGNPNKSEVLSLTKDVSYRLTFNNADVLTTANLANDITVTYEGYALDARQGKVLYDSLVPRTGGTMSGPLVLGGSSTNPAYITSTYSAGGVMLKSNNDVEDMGLHLLIKDTYAIIGRGKDTASALKYTYDDLGTPKSRLTICEKEVLTEASVVNDLTTGGASVPLSAEQGKVLNGSKLGTSGGKITGILTMAGGESSAITTDGDDGLYLKSASKSSTLPPSAVILTDGKVSVGTSSASLDVQTNAEGKSTCTFGGKKVLTTEDVVNDIVTGGTDKAFSAEQGKLLAQKINAYYIVQPSTQTAIDTTSGNLLISVGGYVVAVSFDADKAKFIINGEEVATGTPVVVGSVTLTVSFVTAAKYMLTVSKTAIVFG